MHSQFFMVEIPKYCFSIESHSEIIRESFVVYTIVRAVEKNCSYAQLLYIFHTTGVNPQLQGTFISSNIAYDSEI